MLLNEYYNKMGKYSLLKNNCHAMTTYGLINILGINCQQDLQKNYNVGNLLKELGEKE